ncbi:hypothetical protein LKL35_08670 [Streptomyces sp. ET3-23]|uniref:terpene synthase family protein n=1 Tax=Streptomyces sp. ET3-23 TaxID=2885643 RepID=UPI001D111304|nr:hypothetical protein [Streptomyces sp. ET3-23]MCC2275494.1 hypothetical protein [Streptomyces sp. ET3-23]
MPALDFRYPVKLSLHYRPEPEDFYDWFFSYGLFNDRRQRKIRAKDYPYLAAAGWPASDRQCLRNITAISAALLERDDEWDGRRYGASIPLMQASLTDVLDPDRPPTETRWGPILTDIWRGFAEHVPPRQLRRFRHEVADYIRGCIAYDARLCEHGPFTTVDDYLAAREMPLGQYIDHIMVEISAGIDLGDVLDDPALQALKRADKDRVLLWQDYLSLKKEMADGEPDGNLVIVIARARHCTLQEAADTVRHQFEQSMNEFDRQVDQLKATPLGRRQDVRRFIEGLNNMTAGAGNWTTRSARYTLKDTSP